MQASPSSKDQSVPARPMTFTLMLVTYNELDGLRATMPAINAADYVQILLVDGGSTDGTIEYAQSQGYEVYVQKERGIRRCYEESWPLIRGDIVITFAPDGGSVPECLPPLLAQMRAGMDMVIVSRYKDGAKSYEDDAITAFGNWMFNRLINLFHRGRYTDCMVMYRAYRTTLAYEVDLFSESAYQPMERLFGTVSGCEPLLSIRVARDRYKIGEIPGDEPDRIGGERKLQVWRWGAVYLVQTLREFFYRPKPDKSYPLPAPDMAANQARIKACLAKRQAASAKP
jgi:glycosyltransferase involved in cell wall biosynthesis